MTAPYYEADGVTLYLGDCLEVTEWLAADVLVTDPPYPNNAGHFDEAVPKAREALEKWTGDRALVFWSELERPPIALPLVAVHIWHRTNVNGRPYEPVYDYARDGRKRRSEVLRHAAIFDGAGPGTHEYLGHPTQKPEVIARLLADKTEGVIADPFAGSGSTLVAARNLGRRAIGVEIEERYCEIIARRLDQAVLPL
jgi:DNA modification methylase